MVDGLMAKIIPIGYKEKQKAMQTGKKTQISMSIRREKLTCNKKEGRKFWHCRKRRGKPLAYLCWEISDEEATK